MVFDPFGFLERWISARTLHRLIRAGTIVVLIVFLSHRVGRYANYLVKPLWAVETLIFVIFILSYAIRVDPVDRSRGFKEIVIPLIGAVLPFALLFSPPNSKIIVNRAALYLVFYFMTFATALTVWGLWALRGSFSITVEARPPVMRGPYRWIRHPVYLGEMLTAGTVMLWRFSIRNAILYAVFVVIQLLRTRWEEQKLSRIYPAYRGYAARTFWLLKSGNK
jgi:protein-S-isoprenylcysteine O-methyltransferase Ste14